MAGKSPQGLSVEFVNVGGWLTNGDMALDAGAQFLSGYVVRVAFPSGDGGVVHLFVMGIRGRTRTL